MEHVLDLYTDYLLASFGQTSATGLANLLDGAIKHDTITRLLTRSDFTAKDLWLAVKPLVRTHQHTDGYLMIVLLKKSIPMKMSLFVGIGTIAKVGM